MSAYTEVLEFFIENGIQLTSEQMNELKGVCETKITGLTREEKEAFANDIRREREQEKRLRDDCRQEINSKHRKIKKIRE